MTDGDDTAELLQDWCRGNHEALAALVERNAEWIEGRIRRRRGEALEHVETREQFQDLMVGVLAYAPRFVTANRKQFRALLGRMIENDLADRGRALARRRDFEKECLADSVLCLNPRATAPSAAAAKNEELAWVRLALEFLPDDHRHLIERRVFGGRTFSELEDEFGMTQNTLRMRYNRAVVRMTGIIQMLQQGQIEQLDQQADEVSDP